MAPSRLDHIGRRIQDKLNAASRAFKSRTRWRVFSATPRKYWERRFILRPVGGIAYYDEVELAFSRVLHDKVIERAMAKRAMAVDIAVNDGETNRRLHLTAGVAGNYARCIDDISDKLVQWTQSYGRLGEDGDVVFEVSASEIVEITVFIGEKR